MKCFYHGDADGICAGYCVYANTVELNEKREFIEINYGGAFPLGTISADETVYIVDYSIEPEEMTALLNITENVVWIDHHKTAIEKYKDFDREINGIRYDGIAGCMLTWYYFNGVSESGYGSMYKEAPLFMQLIADYDIWKFEYGNFSRYFVLGFNAENFTPEKLFKVGKGKGLLKEEVDFLINNGRTVAIYQATFAGNYCKAYGFETELDGYKAYALNIGFCSSDNFRSIRDDKYDLYVGFAFDGEKWKYSLRSDKIDVSKIAKKYGGGGHRGAAGFATSEMICKR